MICPDLVNIVPERLANNHKIKYDPNAVKRRNLLKSKFKMIKFRQLSIDSYNRDPLKCKCGNIMVYESSYNPLEGRINDRDYRKECINEMYSLRL